MYGKYGFYEAIDLTPSRVGGGSAVIRSYMSHHMGMSLAACANACFGGIFVKCFMSDPETASSSELLEEKVPVDAHISRVSGSAVQNADRADRSLILYSVKDHGGGEGLCIAVSFECRGGNEEYLLTRSGLGLMYGERDVEALVTADFPDTVYSVGEPFCAVKKESECPGGKYAANILITVGKGRGDAVGSMPVSYTHLTLPTT